MKIYLFLSIILICLVFQSDVSAQNAVPVYLETDKLFQNIAMLSGASVSDTELENFGRYTANGMSEDSNVSYYQIATALISLQKSPRSYVLMFSKPINAIRARYALEADSLLIEYMVALYTPSKSFQNNDPLEKYFLEIQTVKGRKQLLLDLNTRLGRGVERERNAAEIIIEMRENFKEEKLEALRSIIINNSVARLPYPLCLITKNCPK